MPLVWFCWPPNSQTTVFCKNYCTSKALRLTYQLWLNHTGRRRCVSNTRLLSSQLDDVGYFAAHHYWKCLVVHLSLSVYNKWGETCTFFSRIKMLSSRRNKLTNMFFCKQYFDPGTSDIFFEFRTPCFGQPKGTMKRFLLSVFYVLRKMIWRRRLQGFTHHLMPVFITESNYYYGCSSCKRCRASYFRAVVQGGQRLWLQPLPLALRQSQL